MMHQRRPDTSQNTRGVGDLILPTLSSTTTALKKVDFGRFERVVDNLIVKNKTDVDTQQLLEKLRTGTSERLRRSEQKESNVSTS